MKTQKRIIAIVCGGDSSEHDVSLRSAQGLYSFFDHDRYEIYIVDVKGTDWHVNLDNCFLLALWLPSVRVNAFKIDRIIT